MIKSILITAIRNLIRNRTFSVINLIGLSISMSLSLLIIVMVNGQFQFDNFHKDADRIYRVDTKAIRKSGGTESYASSPMALGVKLGQDFSFIDKVVKICSRLGGDVKFEKTVVPYNGFFVDPGFFEVFNFPLEKGNAKEALRNPNSIVVAHGAVQKIFGDTDPIGKTVSLDRYGDFIVTGIVAPPLGKSHIDFDILASTSLLPLLEKEGKISPLMSNWNDYYSGYNYIKLQPGTDPDDVNQALREISDSQYQGLSLETRDKGYEFFLQPLSDITPGPLLSNQLGRGLPKMLLIFLGGLAAIVMVMACFNYTNLMIAKSLTRTREIGIRKINGATRFHVFLQFVGESVVFALLALAISYLLMQWMKPGVMQLHIADEFDIGLLENHYTYLYFLLFAIAIGAIAGLLPSIYLSAFKPLRVLKGADVKVGSQMTFRKVLIASQFGFSVIFISLVIITNQQIKYMLNADYGFNQQNLLNVRLQGNDFQKFKNEVSTLAGVNRVGGVSHSLGTWADRSGDYKRHEGDESFVMRDFGVDAAYIENLQLDFVAGKGFEEEVPANKEKVLLNEMALSRFGFDSPGNAIGQTIIADDTIVLEVIGVVRDFHFRPLNYQIGPIAFRYDPESITMASIAYSGDPKLLGNKISQVWSKLDPVHPVDMMSMSDEIDKAYADSGFTDVVTILGYIAFLAISLACLGMLGMAMYTTQTRIKEIGLRKALGASVSSVVLLLSRSFLVLIGMGILVGAPIAYFLGDLFLGSYAYRISITPWMLFSGIFLLIVLGGVTIASQTLAAASRSPVKSLRYE